jgi:hypothetical protein
MCKLLCRSRSGYYDQLARQEQLATPPDESGWVAKMRAFQIAARGTYGKRRMHRELTADST